MRRSSRWIGIGIATLILGLAIGGVIALFLAYQHTPNYYLKGGENSYSAGVDAFNQKDDGSAALRFHEAMLQADLCLGQIEKIRGEQKDLAVDQHALLMRQEGLAFWLKLKALRARATAKTRSEGKPLPPIDGVSPEQAREYFAKLIPSRLSEEAARRDGLACLRQAALRLADVEEIQWDAVQQELQLEPKQWPLAQQFAANLLKLKPKDERAHYILARYEFEQPQIAPDTGATAPSPPLKRSLQRMTKALEHLTAVKAAEQPARWRTLHLEAEVDHWLTTYYRDPNHKKPDEEQKTRAALRQLLFGADGALARAAEAGSFGPLSRLDTEGILDLHWLALEQAVEMSRSRDRNGSAAAVAPFGVAEVLAAFVNTANKITTDQPTPFQIGLCFDALTQAGVHAQPFVARDHDQAWTAFREAVQKTGHQAVTANQGEVASFVRLAELLGRDADRLANKQDPNAPKSLRQQALNWLDVGFSKAQARKLPQRQLIPLHVVAVRLKARLGAKAEDLAAHLQALKESDQAPAQAVGFLLEGALAEREGRLEKARDLMERAATLGAGTDIARRAHSVLATLYLVLDQPYKALGSIQEVQKAYARWDQLADEEKSWIFEFLRSPQEVELLRVHAHLACAAQAWRRLALRGQAAAGEALEIMKQQEQEAARLVAGLPEKSALNRLAREKIIAHLASTQRLDQAAEQLDILRRDYADSVSVLRIESQLALAKAAPSVNRAELVVQIDAKIRQFIQANPANSQARLYWAEWLLTTQRAAEAGAYLGDPVAFAGLTEGPQYQRLRTLAVLSGGAASPSAVQAAVIQDPVLDLALIQASTRTEEKQRQLGEALLRYENNGLFRCASASLAAERRDFAEAARAYAAALDITSVRTFARAGLQSVLFAFAQQNPEQARDLIALLLQDRPAEPTLLLGYAECCFLLGDFGDPKSKLTKIQDLATALAAHEQALERDGTIDPGGPWMKAQYWQRANRPDLARGELTRLLATFPEHDGALAMVAQLALLEDGSEAWNAAMPFVERLRKKLPGSPAPLLLTSQLQVKLGQRGQAKTTLETCLKKFPKCSAAYAGLVDLLGPDGDLSAGLALIRTWQKECPDDVMAWQAEVYRLAAAGQTREAAAIIEEQAQRRRAHYQGTNSQESPATEQIVRMQTVVLCRGLLQAKAYPEAAALLKGLLDAQPQDESALLLLGDLYLMQFQDATKLADRAALARQAQAAFAKVYTQRKGHVIAGNNLAWLLICEGGDPEEALRLLKEVRANRYTGKPMPAEMLPADVIDTFGRVYQKLNKPDLAAEEIELFRAARQRYPADPRICLHLGRAMQRAGKKADANQLFAAALTLIQQPSATIEVDKRSTLAKEVLSAQQNLK